MAVVDNSNILQIDLPAGTSLLEASADGFIDHLFKIATSLIHASRKDLPSGVLLFQRAELSDFSNSWLKELRSEILVCELTRRVLRLRALQAIIQLSPVEWCWSGKESCLGSWFDLALSCHRRIWLSTEAEVGFPEIRANVAPWGFSLELIQIRHKIGKEIWESSPTISIVKATTLKIIDAVANASDPLKVGRKWFQGHLRLHFDLHDKREKLYLAERDAIRQWAEAESISDEAGAITLQYYAEENGKNRMNYGADFTFQLQKDRKKTHIRKNFEAITSFVTAKSFTTRSHVAWVSGQVASTKAIRNTTNIRRQHSFVIDLNSGTPPASCIQRLVDDQRPVVLAASSSRILTESLTILFARLEKTMSGPKASVAWDRYVSWYIGPIRAEDFVVGFSREESIAVRTANEEFKFYRLEGNHPAAPVGWCEAIANLNNEHLRGNAAAQEFVHGISDGIIQTPGADPMGTPLFAVIRLLMLEEIHRVSAKFGAEVDQTLEGLKSEGWGFIAHAAAWERFLPQKFARAAAKSILFDELSEALFERRTVVTSTSTNLRHVREIKRVSAEGQARRTSALRLSQHLLYFVGAIDGLLAGRSLAMPRGDLRRLVREAAGLPQQAGSPHSFVSSRGRARTLNYLCVNWPQLALSQQKIPGIVGEEL